MNLRPGHLPLEVRGRRATAALGLAAALLFVGCGREAGGPTRLTIAYSNDLHGEIRSCGCAVHDTGGLGRRATFLSALRDTTGDMILVDGGDFFGAGINYGREKAELTMKSMQVMHYDAVVIGEVELGFGIDYITRRSREVGLPVIACNLADAATDTLLFPPARVVTRPSGLRVGLVGVISPDLDLPPQVEAGRIEIREPVAAAQAVVDSLRPDVDVVVVLAHMPRGEVMRIAPELSGVDIIIHGHEGRPMRKVRRFGEAFVLQVPDRGLYVGVAYATLKREGRVADLQNVMVPMDKRFEDAESIAKLFAAYDLDIAAKERGILTTARAEAAEPFAGDDACADCHGEIHAHWAGTRHAHAFETLVANARELDRDCAPCHTTGFYKKGGFESTLATPGLLGVQCESCHGNGHRHASDPDVRTGADARVACGDCHTGEQSPEFDFEAFWARIKHPEGPGAADSKPR